MTRKLHGKEVRDLIANRLIGAARTDWNNLLNNLRKLNCCSEICGNFLNRRIIPCRNQFQNVIAFSLL